MLYKLTELEVYALLELGQVAVAQERAQQVINEYKLSDPSRAGSAGHLAFVHHVSILPSVIEERFGNWDAALAKLPKVEGDFETELAPWLWQARRYYYIGEQSAAKDDLDTLREAHITLNAFGETYHESANQLAKGMGAIEHWYREKQIIDQHLHLLLSRSAELRGDDNLAITQLRNALTRRDLNLRRPPPLTPRQPRQELGELALSIGDAALARRAFNQALQTASINQATAWLGLAESFHALGDPRAAGALQAFDRAWSTAERDHPLLQPYWQRADTLRAKLQQGATGSAQSTE